MLAACWKQHQQLLRSEGLEEDCLQAAWSALSSHVKERIAQGRGSSISGLCKLLLHFQRACHSSKDKPSAAGLLSVVLSEQLLKQFPQLKLGAGVSNFAAVKDQAQGAENISFVALSQRTFNLSREALQLILRVLIGTIHSLIAAQQSFTADLGVGQLRFSSGGLVTFQLSAGVDKSFIDSTAVASGAADSGSSSVLNAETLSQFGRKLAAPSKASSTLLRVSKVSRQTTVSAATAAATANSSLDQTKQQQHSLSVSGVHFQQACSNSGSKGSRSIDGLPEKPGSTPISPNELILASRQARAAAQANARIKPATFVLPAGGPLDAEEQHVPQGKGKPVPAGQMSKAQNQVLEAAAARQQRTAITQAATEEELAAKNAQLKATLDQQAQAIMQQREASKRQLAEALSQQIRDRRTMGTGKGQPQGGALLIAPPDPAAVALQRAKQQAEYRAALDQQLAAKATMQRQLKAQDTEQALAELALVQQSLVATAQAHRNRSRR